MPSPSTGVPRVFAIILNESSARDEVLERLRSKYKANYEVLPNALYLIRTTDLANSVADTLGIGGQDPNVTGAVIKVNDAYAGYFSSDLWDWLGE